MSNSKSNNFFYQQLLKNDLVAAPMAGISTAPFRYMLREFFDGIVYTELVSVEGIRRNNDNSMEYLDIFEGDRPVIAQFFGGNADSYIEAVRMAEEHSSPDGFDINSGCPVKKVIKAGGGCALLQDIDKIGDIVQAVKSATNKPLSVKIRVGLDDKNHVYKEILKIVESAGADALILHARTKNQMFGGAINYQALTELANMAKIPVIGNGSVVDYESYVKMKATGVDGVMIGRAMMKYPWVFETIKKKLPSEKYLSNLQKYELLMRLHALMEKHAGDIENKRTHYINILRKYAIWFSRGFENAAEFRGEIYKDADEARFFELVKRFYCE